MIGIIWLEINIPTGRVGPLSAAYARADISFMVSVH